MSSPELPFLVGLSPYNKKLIERYVANQQFANIETMLQNHPQNAERFRQWKQNPDCFLKHLPQHLISIVQKNIRDKMWATLKKLIDATNADAVREFASWATRNNYNTTDKMRNAFSEQNFEHAPSPPPPPYAPRNQPPQGAYNQQMYIPFSHSLQNMYQPLAYLNAYQRAGIPTYQQIQPTAQHNNYTHSFKIPGSVVGLLFGAGGSTLNKFQQQFSVRIVCPKRKYTAATSANINVHGPSDEQVFTACLAIMDKTTSKTTFKTVLADNAILKGVRTMNKERIFDFCKVYMVYMDIRQQTLEIRAHTQQSLTDAKKSLDDEFGSTPLIQKTKKKKNKAKKNKEKFVRPPVVVQPPSQSAFSYLKDHTNILLLGVSGVGKSTFLNAIANYFAFGDDYIRGQRELTVTIPANFSKEDDQGNWYEIELRPEGSNDDGPNENHAVGESATQEPRCYTFKFKVNGKDKFIRIIDTPGLIDTEGVIKDREHMTNILSYLTHFETIQAVCMLTKPSEAKLSPPIRYYINELLSVLHKDAAANIIFLFPRAMGSHFKPGETREILEVFLTDVKDKYNVEISLTRETMFCFDNDGYRYYAARKFGKLPETTEAATAKDNWVRSTHETERLIKQISKLPDYKIGKTLAIQNARSILIAFARPLADLSRKHMNCKLSIKEKVKEINRLKAEGADLFKHLHFEVDFPCKVAVATPRVVCSQCATPLGNGLSDLQICHNNCECVEADVLGFNPKIEMCTVFANADGICTDCGCPFNVHQRIDYDMTTHFNKEINGVVQTGMDNKLAQEKAAEEFISKLKEEEKKQIETIQLIKKHSAAFAVFVRQNSIVACNDAFCHYVEQCIQDEEGKFGTSEWSKKRRDELKAFKEQYEQELAFYNTLIATGTPLTLENVHKKLQELLNNEEIGQYLSELKNYLEVSTTGELQHERCQQLTNLFGKPIVE